MQNEVDWGLGMLPTKPEVIDKRRKICVKFEVFFCNVDMGRGRRGGTGTERA